MFLVFDVGNINMVLGIYKGDKLVNYWRIKIDREKMFDEYGILISNLFDYDNVNISDIDDVIILFVVLNVMYFFENFCIKYCKK